jgi:transcription initiation factor TFIIB
VASGCLYAACRQEGLPRSLEEIKEVSRVEKIEIGRAYRYVAAELNLALEPVDPEQFVPRYISELDLGEDVKAQAETIIETCRSQGLLAGKSPTGFAAAAIYAASLLCDDKRTQQEVAAVANVTEVTIRNRYQEQLQALEES